MARSNSSVTGTLSDIVDDTKDFVDDEVIDRGKDTERDLRRAGRNLTGADDDDRRSGRRVRRESARDDRDARRRSRRGGGSATNLLSDITDSTKDFVDDEILDRGKDTERDLRQAGRNWTHSDDDGGRGSGRGSRRGSSRGAGRSDARGDDVDELRDAISALTKKVDELSKK